MNQLILLLLAIALTSCSHDTSLMKKEETLNAYAATVRWSMFEQAVDYQVKKPRPGQDARRMRGFKVTGYDVISQREEPERNLLRQIVEIRYQRPDEVIERQIVDEEIWVYNPDADRWFLDSDLPQFP